jgi:DNA sulfur modification protein DndD
MKLLELTMYNFMPYHGDHRITFPTDASRNVAVVFGDNMRGKTSLLNAIRWCLYGQAVGRHLKVLDLANMVNSDAAARGEHRVAVYLRFEANGHEYDLRRIAEPRELVTMPRNSGDFRVDVSLRKDGRVMRGDEVEHELNQLAPEQVSRFFLFDGELLQEYETLLTEGSEQGEKIKAAIEQVLGVPALLDGRKRLGGLLRQAQGVQAKENRHIAALRSVAEQQIQLQERLAAISADLEALLLREGEIESEIEELDKRLAATAAVERVKAAIDGITSQRDMLLKREDQLRAEKLACLRDAWRDLLQPRLQLRIQELNSASETFRAGLERQGALKERVRQLRSVLDTATCASCGQAMNTAMRDNVGAELGRVEGELAEVSADMGRFRQVSEELTRLSRLRSTGAASRIRRIEGEIDQTAIELTAAETKLEKLHDQIRGEDTAEIARMRALRDQRQRNLGKVQQDIATRRSEIDSQTARQNELARLMSKNTEARSQRSNREVELYGALERVFAQGIDVLRNRLRQGVAELASESFLRLTTEKTYRELKINEHYGLSIIDRDGRTVSVRSAGAEQIVALALIDGLNRTARKSGPIIMDTPLGRLDPKHRAAVLTEVPRMAEQVVLLVHEGEIDKATGLQPLASRIGAVYDIVRVSSSQSRIEDARIHIS